MSETHGTTGASTRADERYGAIETADGDTVIYDRSEKRAWIQSSHTVDIDA
jgi:hypothetical protein